MPLDCAISIRRKCLGLAITFAGIASLVLGQAAETSAVSTPRATSGDTSFEPAWRERLTVTVGPDKAQIIGRTETALQAAIDYVARLGGGTVQVLPGIYRMRNAIYLQSKVRLAGRVMQKGSNSNVCG